MGVWNTVKVMNRNLWPLEASPSRKDAVSSALTLMTRTAAAAATMQEKAFGSFIEKHLQALTEGVETLPDSLIVRNIKGGRGPRSSAGDYAVLVAYS